jgi:hypothetical protein
MSAVHSVATAVLRFFVRREQKNVALTLLVSFRMEVINKFLQRPSQRCFAEQDQLAQALLFHRPHPAFCKCIGIRRQLHPARTLRNDIFE